MNVAPHHHTEPLREPERRITRNAKSTSTAAAQLPWSFGCTPLRKCNLGAPRLKTLYLDMDNVLVDFESAVVSLHPDVRNKYSGRLDEVPGIFSRMKPMTGAVESFQTLSTHFDTFILYTAPWENPTAWSDKLVWVREYLGTKARKRLILSHNKQLNRGHFLVDDRTKNGASEFSGELLLFGSEDFPNWDSVTKDLLERV